MTKVIGMGCMVSNLASDGMDVALLAGTKFLNVCLSLPMAINGKNVEI
jgi:hypothetical protein